MQEYLTHDDYTESSSNIRSRSQNAKREVKQIEKAAPPQ